MKIQDAAREVRHALGVTQPELGQRLGVTKGTIIQYENHVPPRGMMLLRFAELAEEVKRPDLAVVFRTAIIQELNESGTTRPAFEGLLKQYFVNLVALIKERLTEYESSKDPETARLVLSTLSHTIDWLQLQAIFLVCLNLHEITRHVAGWQKKEDPEAEIVEIGRLIEVAERVLAWDFDFETSLIKSFISRAQD